MGILQLLLLLGAAALASAFLDREKGLHLFTLPETRSPLHHAARALHGHSTWRMLQRREGGYPEVHDAHEFVGATRLGFISLNVRSLMRRFASRSFPPRTRVFLRPQTTAQNTRHIQQVTAIVKSSTVQTDDYLDLLMAAQLDCIPRPVPLEHQGQGHVALTISFPGQQPPDQEALAHLLDRLAHPDAVLSFGVDTLLAHPSLDREGSCVRHVPGRDPFFRVLELAQLGSSVTLDLSPTSPQDAFRYLSFSMAHTPDAEGEVARRRALGQWTGRQLPITYSEPIASYGINWNGNAQAPGAATAKLPLFSAQPNALYCDNCFFYLGATLNINVQVCAIIRDVRQYIYFYDASLPSDVIASGKGYYYTTSADTTAGAIKTTGKDDDARAMTDCKALNTPKPYLFNVGFSAEVFFSGSAAFNFAIASDGITASPPLAFPSTCTAPSTSCTPTRLPGIDPVVIPTISTSVMGVPITIDPTITLSGAALGSLSMPSLVLRFGASASVSLKLGGKVSFAGIPDSGPPLYTSRPPTLTIVPYFDFRSTFSQQPFKLSGFTAASGSIDATIVPIIAVTIWKILPFVIQPSYNMVQTLTAGSRQLGLRGDAQVEGELGKASAGGRTLPAVGCTAGQVSSTASAKGALGVILEPVTAFSMIKSVTRVDMTKAVNGVAKLADVSIIPKTTIVDRTTTSFAVDGAVPAAASACIAMGSAISLGGTLSGGGGGGSGGAARGSSGGDSAALSGGAIIGVAVGSSVGGLLLLGGLYYFLVLRRQAPGAAATAVVVSSKVASGSKTTASNGGTDVRYEHEGDRTHREMSVAVARTQELQQWEGPARASWRTGGALTAEAPQQQQQKVQQLLQLLQNQQLQQQLQQLQLQHAAVPALPGAYYSGASKGRPLLPPGWTKEGPNEEGLYWFVWSCAR